MPAPVYDQLKERSLKRVRELYPFVTVPKEAPEKPDYGDLDILVLGEPNAPLVTHAQVQEALGASHAIPFSGARTSHYAVPVSQEDWPSNGGGVDQEERYFQVDVHVCEDRADFDAIEFFHSYGDLGMILGLLIRTGGLSLGTHGLKVRDFSLNFTEECVELTHHQLKKSH